MQLSHRNSYGIRGCSAALDADILVSICLLVSGPTHLSSEYHMKISWHYLKDYGALTKIEFSSSHVAYLSSLCSGVHLVCFSLFLVLTHCAVLACIDKKLSFAPEVAVLWKLS